MKTKYMPNLLNIVMLSVLGSLMAFWCWPNTEAADDLSILGKAEARITPQVHLPEPTYNFVARFNRNGIVGSSVLDNKPEELTVFDHPAENILYQSLRDAEFSRLKKSFGDPTQNYGEIANEKLTFNYGALTVSPRLIKLGPIGISVMGARPSTKPIE